MECVYIHTAQALPSTYSIPHTWGLVSAAVGAAAAVTNGTTAASILSAVEVDLETVAAAVVSTSILPQRHAILTAKLSLAAKFNTFLLRSSC